MFVCLLHKHKRNINFNIGNLLMLFSDKKSGQFLFCCPMHIFFSKKSLQFHVNYSHTRVLTSNLCLLFICTTSNKIKKTKSNTCNQIEVFLERDFKLHVLRKTVFRHISTKSN